LKRLGYHFAVVTNRKWSVVSASALVLTIYLLRLDRVAGLMIDDAWYILLGRAVASGNGYQLSNAPTPGLLPPYPPFFALLLAAVFRVAPAFPANVLLLKAISILAMLATGALTYTYVRQRRDWPHELALLVAVGVALIPSLVFFAASTVMSECVFLTVQLATIVALERWRSSAGTAAAGAGAALTTLTRTAGIALPIASLLYLCIERQWRRAILFGGVVLVMLAPWQLYAARHAPTMAQRLEHGGGHTLEYGQLFWMRWAGDPESGTVSARDLPARVWSNTVDVFGRDVIGLVAPALLRGPDESGEEALAIGGGGYSGSMGNSWPTLTLSFLLSAIAITGFVRIVASRPSAAEYVMPVSLLIVVLWPFWSFRYVLPLAPFLFFYLVDGLRGLTPKHSRVPSLVMAAVVGLFVLDHCAYITRAHAGNPDWWIDAEDTDAVIAWLEQHPTDGIIASTNPALIHLRTGVKTIATSGPISGDALRTRGVRYVVCVQLGATPPAPDAGLIRYRSPQRGFWVLEL